MNGDSVRNGAGQGRDREAPLARADNGRARARPVRLARWHRVATHVPTML